MTRWREQNLTQEELKHASVRGGVITFAAQLVKFILNMAVTVWLAHTLVPEDFGLVAMVMIVVNFFVLFKDAGFSAATVQQEVVTHEQVSLLFWLSAGIGMFLGGLLYLISPMIVMFFHEPRLLEITEVLSLVFVLGGLAIQHEALMRRQMRFRELMMIEISGLIVSAVFAVVLAISGAGYWAMVWLQVVAIIVRVVLLWLLAGWLPSLPVLKVGIRKMVVFGSELTLANVIQYISKQSDQILLGGWSGAHALGMYSTAMQLVTLPLRQILTPLAQVAQATLSRMQTDKLRFRRTYLLLVKLVAYATMPLMSVLAVLAEPLVIIFLGEQWKESIGIIRILAMTGWILGVNVTMGWVLTARGQGKRILKWNLWVSPVFVLFFVCGLPWGAEGVAWGLLLAVYVSRYSHYHYTLEGTAISMVDLWNALCWPACLSVILAGVAMAMYFSLPMLIMWQALLVSILVSFGVLYPVLRWKNPMEEQIMEVWDLLQSVWRRHDD